MNSPQEPGERAPDREVVEDIIERLNKLLWQANSAGFREGAEEREGGSDARSRRAADNFIEIQDRFADQADRLRAALAQLTPREDQDGE